MARVNGLGSKQAPRHARLRVTCPIEPADGRAVMVSRLSVTMPSFRPSTCPHRRPVEVVISKIYHGSKSVRDLTVQRRQIDMRRRQY